MRLRAPCTAAGREEETIMAIRVCVVTETYPPEINGVAMTLSRLVDGLRARDHEVSIVRPRQPGGSRAADLRDPAQTLVAGLSMPRYPGVRLGSPAGRRLRQLWTQQRPDVVYVATEGPLGWTAVRTAHALGVAALSGFHTNFHGYVGHYRAGWLRPIVARYLRGFHNRCHGTLVATPDLLDQLRASGFDNLSVLGRGVDGDLFSPDRRRDELRRSWGAGDGELVALYVGRVAAEKNLELAIEAYRAMRAGHPALRFVVVGDGPLQPTLRAAHPDLIFCGPLTGERLATHYASADVFLFPSTTETFGNVTLEALASGLVVVAYDYAAARMHVLAGETGCLVPFGDARAFVEAAAALARSPERVDRMRRQARASVAGLRWERVVERFEELLLAAARPRSERDLLFLSDGRYR
jgi:glycosyltransferase involved in cell wall biosynthesis